MTFIGTAAKGIGGWLRFSNDIHRHSRKVHRWLATRPYWPHAPFVSRFVANAAAILVNSRTGGECERSFSTSGGRWTARPIGLTGSWPITAQAGLASPETSLIRHTLMRPGERTTILNAYANTDSLGSSNTLWVRNSTGCLRRVHSKCGASWAVVVHEKAKSPSKSAAASPANRLAGSSVAGRFCGPSNRVSALEWSRISTAIWTTFWQKLESRNYSGRLRIRRGLDFSSLMSGFSKRRCASSQWRRVTP